jgi:predicted nucleic acid-binding protein
MAALFLDSSALVKRYIQEQGTAWLSQLLAMRAGNVHYVARITVVEVSAALARRRREGSLLAADVARAQAGLRKDMASLLEVIEITSALLERAAVVADLRELRAYDAVQLAAALEVQQRTTSLGLPPVTLVSADSDLNAAARAEGLTVDDPNQHA